MVTVVGILGAAGIAPAAILRPARRRDDVVVAAVASRRGARAYADRYGIERAYDSYAELEADPRIDLVYNALPPSLHAEWTVAALEAGRHVLCEKPFTGSNPYDPTSLRHDPALGGGALMDLGCYPVHWLRAGLGAEPEVRQAQAVLNPLGADLAIEADLAFPGGLVARLEASMADGVSLASTLTVEGARGRLHVDNLVFPAAGHSIVTEIDGVPRRRTVAGEETYDHQLAAVVEALASGDPVATEGADAIGNMQVIDAIYAAAGVPGR